MQFYFWLFSGKIYSYGCTYPDFADSLFVTRLPDYHCEWLNGPENQDVICLCKQNGCNRAELLNTWVLNGDCGKAYLFEARTFYYTLGLWLLMSEIEISKDCSSSKKGEAVVESN